LVPGLVRVGTGDQGPGTGDRGPGTKLASFAGRQRHVLQPR